jgi:peptidoglycan hydrolase-like protein with peptidoglycan-binding domain
VKKLLIVVSAVLVTIAAPAVAQHATASINKLNMDAVPNIEHDGVREVQSLLKQKGFDPGPLDGVNGPLTSGAIRAFQARYGIATAGAIDNQTLFALGAVDLAGPGSN